MKATGIVRRIEDLGRVGTLLQYISPLITFIFYYIN